ncbi:unnamed protein product, partial [Closterium sp. Yama58-4]
SHNDPHGLLFAPRLPSRQGLQSGRTHRSLYRVPHLCAAHRRALFSQSLVLQLGLHLPLRLLHPGVLFTRESFRTSAFANMVAITVGVAVAAYGEANFNAAGVLLQLAAVCFEALRLVLIQILLTAKGVSLNPITSLFYISPVCLLFLSLPWLLVEYPRLAPSLTIPAQPALVLFLANCTCAFSLNLAVFLLIGKTSALTMNVAGVVKDWLLIAFSWSVIRDRVTAINLIGYLLAFVGVCWDGEYPRYSPFHSLFEAKGSMHAIGKFFKTVYELFDDDDEDEDDNNEGEGVDGEGGGFWDRSGNGRGFWGMGGGAREEEMGRKGDRERNRGASGGRKEETMGMYDRARRRGGGRGERRGDGEGPEGCSADAIGELQTDSNGLTWRPLIRLAKRGDGGVQSLTWYITSLHQDADGDVANDFFVEVLPAGLHASGNGASGNGASGNGASGNGVSGICGAEFASFPPSASLCRATLKLVQPVVVFTVQRSLEEQAAAAIVESQPGFPPLSPDPEERAEQIHEQTESARKKIEELQATIKSIERSRDETKERLNLLLSQAQTLGGGEGSSKDGSSGIRVIEGTGTPDQPSAFKPVRAGPAGKVRFPRTNPPVVPSSEGVDPALESLLLKIASEKEILATVAAAEVQNFMEIWIRQVVRVGITNALVLCLDPATEAACNAASANQVACYLVPNLPAAFSPTQASANESPNQRAASVIDSLNGAKFYVLRDALALGYSILVSDLDVTILRNPFSSGELVRDCDVEAMSVGHDQASAYGYNDVTDDPSMGWARYAHTMRVFAMDSGFFLVRPTAPALELFDRVAARLGAAARGGGGISGLLSPLVVFNEEMFYPSRPDYKGVFISRRVLDIHRFINSKVLFGQLKRDYGRLQSLVGSAVAVHVNYHVDKLTRLSAITSFFMDRERAVFDALSLASS